MWLIRPAFLVACAIPAAAQERITPEDFLDRVEGRTAIFVTFEDDHLVGTEQFVRRDRTVWARWDGTCAYGLVTVEEGLLCFAYDDEPAGRKHCWVPFALDDQLLVVTPDGSDIQQVREITDTPVSCEPPPIS